MEKNISRIYKLSENIFMLLQRDKSASDFYYTLRGKWEELNMYHPITSDIKQLKWQREEFQAVKFLSGLNFNF